MGNAVERCRATANHTGKRCRNYPIRGGTVCRYHGGSAPQVRAAAERRKLREEAGTAAMRMLRQIGADPSPDRPPVEHLLDELRQAALVSEWLGQRAVLDGPTGPLWEVWERERDRRAKLAKFAVDAGLDERRVAVAEGQAMMLAGAIRAVLTAMRGELMRVMDAALVPPAAGESMIVLDQQDRQELEAAVDRLTTGREGAVIVQAELRKLAVGDDPDELP